MPSKHGTLTRYKKGCRCKPCKGANAKWCREYNERVGRPTVRSRLEGESTRAQRHDDRIDLLLEALHGP